MRGSSEDICTFLRVATVWMLMFSHDVEGDAFHPMLAARQFLRTSDFDNVFLAVVISNISTTLSQRRFTLSSGLLRRAAVWCARAFLFMSLGLGFQRRIESLTFIAITIRVGIRVASANLITYGVTTDGAVHGSILRLLLS